MNELQIDTHARHKKETCPILARYTAQILSESWGEPYAVRHTSSGYWVIPKAWLLENHACVQVGLAPLLVALLLVIFV